MVDKIRTCPSSESEFRKGSKNPSNDPREEEEGAQKKDEHENQLKRTKSRELRGGIMYYSCHCIKRNGLQHDCRRTGCGGEPACLVLPDPLCAPSQLARARGLADPAPLAAHTQRGGGGSSGSTASGSAGGKRFIVCELKSIMPDTGADRGGNKCCKCPVQSVSSAPSAGSHNVGPKACVFSSFIAPPAPKTLNPTSKCPCTCASNISAMQSQNVFAFDERTLCDIMRRFEDKELSTSGTKPGPGRGAGTTANVPKEQPCTRPGCVHWTPPPPCVWDAPCKADCFETPAGIQPGRNPLTSGGGILGGSSGQSSVVQGNRQPRAQMKLLTPECCTGCCSPSGQGATASGGGPAAGLPVMVMKLC